MPLESWLPIYRDDVPLNDAVVLDARLSCGVRISALDLQCSNVLNRMTPAHLDDIIQATGVPPAEASLTASFSEPVAAARELPVFALPGRQLLEAFFPEHVIDIVLGMTKRLHLIDPAVLRRACFEHLMPNGFCLRIIG